MVIKPKKYKGRMKKGFLIGGLIGLIAPLLVQWITPFFPREIMETVNPLSLLFLVIDIPALLIPFYREAATMTYHAIYLIIAWGIIGAIIASFGSSKKKVIYGILITIGLCMIIGWIMFNRYADFMDRF